MDTTRIIEPISDRLPIAGAASLASAVVDATSELAEQITGRVSDLELSDKASRTRRTVSRAVPWIPLGSTRPPRSPRRWLSVGLGLAVIVAGVAIWLRRSDDASGGGTDSPARDDWSTHMANGANPSVDAAVDRETAPTGT